MRNLFYLLLIFGFASCGVSSVVVNVQRPADISVPQNIQKVIVANRSTPGKGNVANNIIEGLVTGEGIGSDKKGSEYCMMGLTEMLSGSERYELKNAGEISLKGTGTSTFPPLLKWEKVNSICDSYGADALIVLATFDSDSRIFEWRSVVRTKKIKGVKVCRQANENWVEEFDEREDPKGRKYYWLTGKFVNYDKGDDTDERALENHYISVVPVQYDVTAHHAISKLNNIL